MFDEKSLTPGLSELGYVRLKRLTYKASWSSTDVEHFLFATVFAGGNRFLCDFAIRNPGAEQFALECLKLFSGPRLREFRFNPRYDCSNRFPLGKWAGWSIGWTLTISAFSEAAFADKVKGDVEHLLLPVVRSILSPADLFSILSKNVEPCSWVTVAGGPLRAAQVVYLGRRLGVTTSELRSMLQPYLTQIGGSLGRDVRTGEWQSPSAFLEKILQYAN
jgi:hypothetical protein